jgi:transposase
MPRHRLRDAVWASLHAKLATIPGIWKVGVAALRRFVEAVAYVLRTGLAGEDLPAGLNEPGTVCRRFRRWACKGIWDELFLEGLPADALGTVDRDARFDRLQGAALRERRAGWR